MEGMTPVVRLNAADCDLSFIISQDGQSGRDLSKGGHGYCWAGVRGTHGINDNGRFFFTVKVTEYGAVDLQTIPEIERNLARIGLSVQDCLLDELGESAASFGYGGTGKASSGGVFKSYGKGWGLGDEVGCGIDWDANPATVSFYLNGTSLGTAFPIESLRGKPLFPHIMVKNVSITLDCNPEKCPDGYEPWSRCTQLVDGMRAPPTSDCEVIMLVGLPACGKTTWAKKYISEHPQKRYVLLGTNTLIDKMRVPGLMRKRNYAGRWQELMPLATEVFKDLSDVAPNVPANYIIDQTNVYARARARKIAPFAKQGFKTRAVVVVCSAETMRQRAARRQAEEGKEVPEEAVMEMAANFELPRPRADGGEFDQVEYVDAPATAAAGIVASMRESAKAWLRDHAVAVGGKRPSPGGPPPVAPNAAGGAENQPQWRRFEGPGNPWVQQGAGPPALFQGPGGPPMVAAGMAGAGNHWERHATPTAPHPHMTGQLPARGFAGSAAAWAGAPPPADRQIWQRNAEGAGYGDGSGGGNSGYCGGTYGGGGGDYYGGGGGYDQYGGAQGGGGGGPQGGGGSGGYNAAGHGFTGGQSSYSDNRMAPPGGAYGGGYCADGGYGGRGGANIGMGHTDGGGHGPSGGTWPGEALHPHTWRQSGGPSGPSGGPGHQQQGFMPAPGATASGWGGPPAPMQLAGHQFAAGRFGQPPPTVPGSWAPPPPCAPLAAGGQPFYR